MMVKASFVLLPDSAVVRVIDVEMSYVPVST